MKLELVRAGTYQAKTGEHTLTEKDLDEMVETFGDDVPIALGHERADYMPAFGWIKKVFRKGKSLFGEVSLTQALKDAWEQGYYRKWSVGARRIKETGKLALTHLAFLGAVPPAVKNLQVVAMGDQEDIEEIEVEMAQEEVKKNEREEETTEMGEKKMEELQAELDKLKVALSEKDKTVQEYREMLRKSRLDEVKAAAEGKVPEGEMVTLMTLAENLGVETIELSDKTKVSPVEALVKVLKAMPLPVKEGEMDLGDQTEKKSEEEKPIDFKY